MIKMIEEEIMNIMNDISYGFKDENNNNICECNPKKWDEDFYNFYYLLSPTELLEKKCGVCFDQVELERYLFNKNNIEVKTFFICTYLENGDIPSHTFLTYKKNNKFYYFEHSWGVYRGIHEYDTEKELLIDIKEKFIKGYNTISYSPTIVYEYETPKYNITCDQFYKHAENGKIINLNKPLYFYHLINKDSNMNIGLLSLKYMYDNKMYDLFDKSVEKYKTRIVNDWNIDKYKNRDINSLTRTEILDALDIFRGKYGTNYIYFFRFPPYKELGNKMEEILKVKDIYRIDINNEEVQKNILDIFYGYDMSNSDNKILDKSYYENITKEEYFSKYDDKKQMNFAALNHISIAFTNDYCKKDILTKIDEENYNE